MKQTVWGDSPAQFRQAFQKRVLFCGLITAVVIGLNILCVVLRTENNHTLMLILNILTDILWGCFLVWFVSIYISPAYRLLSLEHRQKEVLSGTVCHIGSTVTRYMDLDCVCVTLEERTLFLPVNTVVLQENTRYTFQVASNMIVEAVL